MLVFRLAMRALAWRAAASVTIFAVALVAVGAATIGPIYLHAVDDTVLSQRLDQAPQSQRDVHVSRQTLPDVPGVDWHGTVRHLARQAADPRWFDPPVFSEEGQVQYHGSQVFATELAAIDGFCRHVTVVSGRCLSASAKDETAISARTARGQHLAVGDTVAVQTPSRAAPIRLRVVGVVRPVAVHGSFWAPWNYFNAAPSLSDTQLPRLDSMFVSHAALAARMSILQQTIAANVHLRPADVHVDDVGALRADVQKVVAAAGAPTGQAPGLTRATVGSQLPDALDAMHSEMSLARNLIILPTVQLVLLAIFVLYAVVAGTAAVHGPEAALAKLRGRRPASILVQGVAAPAVLIVLATPVAALLAWLVVRLVANSLLGRHVAVVFPLWAVAAAAAAALGAVLAAVVGARRIVVSPVGALLRRGADPHGSTVGLAIADAAVVVLALAGLLELLAGGVLEAGKTNPLSALAPTLLAVAAAVVVLRLLPLGGRLLMRWTRDTRRVASFVAVRQIVRRPAGARVLLLVGAALALAAFAVVNWSVARTNREVRALNRTGAATVLTVAPGSNVYDLRRAVDRADPGGTSMAAAVVGVGRSTPLLAVDTARFAGVGTWRSDYAGTPLHQLLAGLRGSPPPSIAFAGTRLRFTVDLTRPPRRPVALTAYVTGANGVRIAYTFGALRSGHHTYATDLDPICRSGCRLTGLAPQPAGRGSSQLTRPGPMAATIGAQARTAHGWQSIAGFGQPSRWRFAAPGPSRRGSAGSSLMLTLVPSADGTSWPQLVSADVPARLPAVLASGTASLYPGSAAEDISASGLDGQPLAIGGLDTSVSLPQLDRYGVMVDYGLALKAASDGLGGEARYQVWLAASAPSDMPARLARQGVRVTRVVHAATYRHELDRTGPALAGGLFLIAAVAAALLALGVAIVAATSTARRRGYEHAALAVAGVAPRALRRASAAEQGVLLGIGLIVGIGAGLGGSRLALPSTPFFVDQSVGPPIQHGLPWQLIGELAGGLAVVFAITSLAVAWLVARQATVARLREEQQ